MHEPKGNLYNIFRLLVLAFQILNSLKFDQLLRLLGCVVGLSA